MGRSSVVCESSLPSVSKQKEKAFRSRREAIEMLLSQLPISAGDIHDAEDNSTARTDAF